MPFSYPTENPASKHDAKSPPPPGTSDDNGSLTVFTKAPQLFRTLQEPTESTAAPLCSFYSYRDAPNPPLSREWVCVGVARRSMPAIRKLIGDDTDDVDAADLPDCLHKCTVAVRRADTEEHVRRLTPPQLANAKAFARFVQRLRSDDWVAVFGTDKYQRFGLWRAADIDDTSGQPAKYRKQDFYAACYVGTLDEVKTFLTGEQEQQSTNDTVLQNNDDTPTYVPKSPPASELPENNDNGPFEWKPPDDEQDNGGANNNGDSGDLWQPPGADNGGSSGDLWQPPGDSSSGGDFSSWLPPESSGFGDFGGGGGGETANAWEQSNDNDDNDKKRNHAEMQDPGGDNADDNADDDETFHANKGAAAADAFYSGLTRKLDTRADSRLYHMRAFNGWVKATQIQELDPKTTSNPTGAMRVLDLACGKGGDLGKWVLHNRGIQDYVGSDVARGSLKDAAIRARNMRNRLKHCTFTCADLGHDVPGRLRSPKQTLMQKLLTWSLHHEPVGGNNRKQQAEPEFKMVRGGGILPDQMFDVVSIQFAIHYMMQTRQRARRFFHTVSQLLEVGGNLIATTIDARVVIGHLMNLGYDLHFDNDEEVSKKEPAEIRVGAGACRIRFEPEIVKKLMQGMSDGTDNCEDLFGLEYTFTLVEGSDHGAGVGDAVNLPEWLTPIPVLTSLAKEVGMELEYAVNFHEFYKQRKDPSLNASAHNSLYSMKVMNREGSISPDEWEISRLYCAVMFRKVQEATTTLEDEDDEMEEEDEDDFVVDPKLKMQLMPMAMMKAKKAAGNDAWAALSTDEKTQLTEVEVKKLAKAAAS